MCGCHRLCLSQPASWNEHADRALPHGRNGAGRARLVRQFLTESLLLALGGGALGLLLASPATSAILSLFNAGPISVLLDVSPDITVLAFTTLASILTGVRYALATAWLALVVAETIGAQSGIGFLAMDAREFLRTDVVVLTIVIYALIGVAADGTARFLERRLLAWHPNYGAAR